ncbi:YSC84-related protein [Danxiaibacter flavus]|uniref:YSC84-related protein n=1 Tax=Danxiaibacter flavus TaxID=3049108 RepID=A0ABV3ZFT0_9BACT|nr:YSC84-related protein [Chitinophagaceae bacterium DXS]
MKKYLLNLFLAAAGGLLLLPAYVKGQHDDKIIQDSKNAREEFIKTDRLMQSLFENSYGYAIFPNVGKGAVGVGGAAGNGVVYEKGKLTGMAKMIQATAGFQFGGQAYREVIFFENKAALDHFKENKLEFSGQASAIAAKEGAAANVKYREGVLIFTQGKGGLMVEAAVGGQKFTYEPHNAK